MVYVQLKNTKNPCKYPVFGMFKTKTPVDVFAVVPLNLWYNHTDNKGNLCLLIY